VPAFYQSRSYFANCSGTDAALQRSDSSSDHIDAQGKWVRINHGQEKRSADYEPKYVLISLGERHLREGQGPDEADFHRQRNVGGFIARHMCKNDHCNARDGQDVDESAAEVWASRQSSCKPQGQSRSVVLAQRMAHPGRPSRRRPAEHSKLAALFALVVLSVTPASADDLIEQWLKKDEASAQTVEARPDLNALTDEQWNEIFKFGREQAEPVEYARETPVRILPLWLAALVVACGIVIGGVKAKSFVRRQLRTLTIPLQMNDPS
jgi:hypothetical protein